MFEQVLKQKETYTHTHVHARASALKRYPSQSGAIDYGQQECRNRKSTHREQMRFYVKPHGASRGTRVRLVSLRWRVVGMVRVVRAHWYNIAGAARLRSLGAGDLLGTNQMYRRVRRMRSHGAPPKMRRISQLRF